MALRTSLSKQNLYIAFVAVLILVILLFALLQADMACLDKNGCPRKSCNYKYLHSDYKAILEQRASICGVTLS